MGFWTTVIGFADFGIDDMNDRNSEYAAVRGIGFCIVYKCNVIATHKLTPSGWVVVQHGPVSHPIPERASLGYSPRISAR